MRGHPKMLDLSRRRRLRVALLSLVVVGALLSACGDDSSPPSSEGAGITVRAGEFNWSAAKLTMAILAEVTKQNPDLGVARIQSTQLGPAAAWAGAERGDLDLLAEVALPNQQELADKAKNRMTLLHQTYGDAAQCWFVLTYSMQLGKPLSG